MLLTFFKTENKKNKAFLMLLAFVSVQKTFGVGKTINISKCSRECNTFLLKIFMWF